MFWFQVFMVITMTAAIDLLRIDAITTMELSNFPTPRLDSALNIVLFIGGGIAFCCLVAAL